jgi:divalent metal cation (Fe/Co/Zn/Cd) transporter
MNNLKRKNAFQYAKETSNLFTDLYGRKMGRSLNITGVAATASTFIAVGKLIIGILSLSLFTCANAFYSFGMIIAKSIALTGIRKARDEKEQYQYYLWSGVVLIVSSLIYIMYSIRLFFSPITNYYHMYVAIGIAAVTFTEIGINIRGVMITKQNHTLLVHAIKMINLSGSFISLVLTQTALLSFTKQKADLLEVSKANGIIGLLTGGVATLIGVYMIYRAKKLKRQQDVLIKQKEEERKQ